MSKRFARNLLILFVCLIGLGAVWAVNDTAQPDDFVGEEIVETVADAAASEDVVNIEWLYPPKYFFGNNFSEGRAWVQEEEDGPWTLLDDKGNVLKEGFEAFGISEYQNGSATFVAVHTVDDLVLAEFDKRGLLDKSGDVVVSSLDLKTSIGLTDPDHLMIKKGENGLYGAVNLEMEWVIPPTFEGASYFQEGLCPVSKNGKYGYIDTKGEIFIDFIYDLARPFSDGIAVIKMNGKYGLIDKQGCVIAEPIYDGYYHPWSDPIGMEKDGKVGFIDSTGKIVIDFEFPARPSESYLYCFNNGRAGIILSQDIERKTVTAGVIDESGKVLFQTNRKPYFRHYDYMFDADKNGQFGVFDRDGKRYALPFTSQYPDIFIDLSVSGIATYTDRKNNKTGYFIMRWE